jgi:hypothetical protein
MATLLIGFDSAWTARNSGPIDGVLRSDDGQYKEPDLPASANFDEAKRVVQAGKTNGSRPPWFE